MLGYAIAVVMVTSRTEVMTLPVSRMRIGISHVYVTEWDCPCCSQRNWTALHDGHTGPHGQPLSRAEIKHHYPPSPLGIAAFEAFDQTPPQGAPCLSWGLVEEPPGPSPTPVVQCSVCAQYVTVSTNARFLASTGHRLDPSIQIVDVRKPSTEFEGPR